MIAMTLMLLTILAACFFAIDPTWLGGLVVVLCIVGATYTLK